MQTQSNEPSEINFSSQLQDCASQLVSRLQDNNFEGASELINELVDARDKHIFNSVGQLTRALHDAISNFHVDANIDSGSDSGSAKNSEIRDASDRLSYVIELTQKAADKTMDKVEGVTPLAKQLGEEASELRDKWHKLKRREMSKGEFKCLYDQMGGFLDQMEEGTAKLSANLQDIILEQGFQDLTGQVLKKVIGLIIDVEAELVKLMRIAGQVEQVAGLASSGQSVPNERKVGEAEGPQLNAEKREDVVSGQDDVDDLLSSLGF